MRNHSVRLMKRGRLDTAGGIAHKHAKILKKLMREMIDEKCEAGIKALGFYHEKKYEQRSLGLGPSLDWSSHAADAFGLMA